jgi:hypothetical protein
VHDPGKIVEDLAVAMAVGGDSLADVTMLRAEPRLSGPVASDPWCPAGHRPGRSADGNSPGACGRAGTGRALAGDNALGVNRRLISVDLDATIVTA